MRATFAYHLTTSEALRVEHVVRTSREARYTRALVGTYYFLTATQCVPHTGGQHTGGTSRGGATCPPGHVSTSAPTSGPTMRLHGMRLPLEVARYIARIAADNSSA